MAIRHLSRRELLAAAVITGANLYVASSAIDVVLAGGPEPFTPEAADLLARAAQGPFYVADLSYTRNVIPLYAGGASLARQAAAEAATAEERTVTLAIAEHLSSRDDAMRQLLEHFSERTPADAGGAGRRALEAAPPPKALTHARAALDAAPPGPKKRVARLRALSETMSALQSWVHVYGRGAPDANPAVRLHQVSEYWQLRSLQGRLQPVLREAAEAAANPAVALGRPAAAPVGRGNVATGVQAASR